MSGLTENSLHLLLYYVTVHCAATTMDSAKLTLCNHTDCSPPGSSVHEIIQARIQSGLPYPPWGDLPDTYIYVDIYIYLASRYIRIFLIYIYIHTYIHTHVYFKMFFGWSVWRKSSRIHTCGWAKEESFSSLFRKLCISLYTGFWEVIVS